MDRGGWSGSVQGEKHKEERTTEVNSGQNVVDTSSSNKVLTIVEGDAETVLLASDGDVYTAGWNGYGQLGKSDNVGTTTANPIFKKVTTGSKYKIVAISAGVNHTVLLDSNGDVYTAGHNYYGKLVRSDNVGTHTANTNLKTPSPHGRHSNLKKGAKINTKRRRKLYSNLKGILQCFST